MIKEKKVEDSDFFVTKVEDDHGDDDSLEDDEAEVEDEGRPVMMENNKYSDF